jgi:hypothetical protein
MRGSVATVELQRAEGTARVLRVAGLNETASFAAAASSSAPAIDHAASPGPAHAVSSAAPKNAAISQAPGKQHSHNQVLRRAAQRSGIQRREHRA